MPDVFQFSQYSLLSEIPQITADLSPEESTIAFVEEGEEALSTSAPSAMSPINISSSPGNQMNTNISDIEEENGIVESSPIMVKESNIKSLKTGSQIRLEAPANQTEENLNDLPRKREYREPFDSLPGQILRERLSLPELESYKENVKESVAMPRSLSADCALPNDRASLSDPRYTTDSFIDDDAMGLSKKCNLLQGSPSPLREEFPPPTLLGAETRDDSVADSSGESATTLPLITVGLLNAVEEALRGVSQTQAVVIISEMFSIDLVVLFANHPVAAVRAAALGVSKLLSASRLLEKCYKYMQIENYLLLNYYFVQLQSINACCLCSFFVRCSYAAERSIAASISKEILFT